MPNYQNGKIYKIINDENDLVYYGSTTQSLCRRFTRHKDYYKKFLETSKRLCYSTEILKYNNPMIILVEDFPCERKEQLTARERFYIENNKCVNKYIPGRTPEEYRKDKADIIKKKDIEYRTNNKEFLKESKMNLYNKNKDSENKKRRENRKEKRKNIPLNQ